MRRDEKQVTLGFMAYQQFFSQALRKKAPPTYESFAKSNLYIGFIRFGRYLVDLNAINTRGFIDFLIRVEAPLSKWTSPALYDTYIRELTRNETPLEALERCFTLMRKWGDEHARDWQDFFRHIATPQAVLWIANGRLSPWLLFIAGSAHDLMHRFNAEQLAMVERAIDPDFWRLKIERHQNDVDMIRLVLDEHGI